MNRKLLFLLIILPACLIYGYAQTFSVSATAVYFSGNAQQNDVVSPAWLPTIHNTSGDTLRLRWKRVEQNIPPWWRSSVCAEYYCWSIPDDSATWTLLPGDSDMLYVHIYPYGFADTGNVVLNLFNLDSPADSVRITYYCDVVTGMEEESALLPVLMQQDGCTLSVTAKQNVAVEFLDLSGRTLQMQFLNNGEISAFTP